MVQLNQSNMARDDATKCQLVRLSYRPFHYEMMEVKGINHWNAVDAHHIPGRLLRLHLDQGGA